MLYFEFFTFHLQHFLHLTTYSGLDPESQIMTKLSLHFQEFLILFFFGSVRSSRKANVCLFLLLMISALELTLFIIFSQVILRIVSGQSQESLRSVSGQSQVSPRSVSSQSQVSPQSLSGLSVLNSSDRRSLKYFVLF